MGLEVTTNLCNSLAFCASNKKGENKHISVGGTSSSPMWHSSMGIRVEYSSRPYY